MSICEDWYAAIAMELKIPPNSPGIPCKLCTPEVSIKFILTLRNLLKYMYPKVEIIPVSNPTVKLAAGLVKSPEGAPMTTPPVKVALRMSSMSNFYLNPELIMKAPRQLPVNATIVLEIMMDLSWVPAGKKPALKEGQNIQRKRVPIIANVTEFLSC